MYFEWGGGLPAFSLHTLFFDLKTTSSAACFSCKCEHSQVNLFVHRLITKNFITICS